jgi:outer membrane lipoprotein-sorting protein
MRPDDAESADIGAEHAPHEHAADPERPAGDAGVFRRHRALASRAAAPLAVVAIVAAGAAIAPSFADAAPSLPAISAQNLLAKAAGSKVDAFSGTARLTVDLGLPALPDLGGGVNELSLLTGTHTLQVAQNGPDRQRVALLGDMSEYDVVHDGAQLWVYDSSENSVGHAVAAPGRPSTAPHPAPGQQIPLTPQQAARQVLAAISPTTAVSVDGTQRVAGQAAYTLVLRPTQPGTLIGQVSIAIDAANGAALRVTVYPQHSGTPIFDLGFSSVSFTAPPDARFDFTAPQGAKVTELGQGSADVRKPGAGTGGAELAPQTLGTGWVSVVELHGVDLAAIQSQAQSGGGPGDSGPDSSSGMLSGDSSDILSTLLGSGHQVGGAFGTGKLFTTSALSVLATSDGRLFAGAVTPAVLEADAAAAAR